MGTKEKIEELLTRGVGEFVDPNGVFRKKLEAKARGEGGDVVIKFGVDPTRPDIHLGHAVIFRRLRQFQELGCKVVFVIGDFTAQIGDPSGKTAARPQLLTKEGGGFSAKEVEHNTETYLAQAGKILSTAPSVFSWIKNSDWFYTITDIVGTPAINPSITFQENSITKTFPLDPNSFVGKAAIYEATRMQVAQMKRPRALSVSLRGFLWTLQHITHQQLSERSMFRERIEKNIPLFMHEMLYPVLQGVDSYVISQIYGSCDLEIGGIDQTFNMLIGRDVQEINMAHGKNGEHDKLQSVLGMKLLVGTDGKEKMSKSSGNYISVADLPDDMFGKVMAVHDGLLLHYFELCTYTPQGEAEELVAKAETKSVNPRDVKMRLAHEIVSIYHGEKSAESAREHFVKTFKEKEMPTDAPTITVPKGTSLYEALKEANIAASNTELRRLVDDGSVHDMKGNTVLKDGSHQIESPLYIRIGKRRFLKISVAE